MRDADQSKRPGEADTKKEVRFAGPPNSSSKAQTNTGTASPFGSQSHLLSSREDDRRPAKAAKRHDTKVESTPQKRNGTDASQAERRPQASDNGRPAYNLQASRKISTGSPSTSRSIRDQQAQRRDGPTTATKEPQRGWQPRDTSLLSKRATPSNASYRTRRQQLKRTTPPQLAI